MISKLGLDARAIIHLQDEIAIHQRASAAFHPNMIQLHNVVDSTACIYLVTTYCPAGDLFEHIIATPSPQQLRLSESHNVIKSIMLQLIDGMSFLHSLGIAHRDLKPENMYWTAHEDDGSGSQGRLLIGDFGLATEERWTDDFGSGTSFYASPEAVGYFRNMSPIPSPPKSTKQHIFSSKHSQIDFSSDDDEDEEEDRGDTEQDEDARYHSARRMQYHRYDTHLSDIWSMGIILINLVCERNPWQYPIPDQDEAFAKYIKQGPNFLWEILPNLSKECHSLLSGMLKLNPEDRLSLSQIRRKIEAMESFNTGVMANPSGDGLLSPRTPGICYEGSWIDMGRIGSAESSWVSASEPKLIVTDSQGERITHASNIKSTFSPSSSSSSCISTPREGAAEATRSLRYCFPPPVSAPLYVNKGILFSSDTVPSSVPCQLSLSSSTQDSGFAGMDTPADELVDPLDKLYFSSFGPYTHILHSSSSSKPLLTTPTAHLLTPTNGLLSPSMLSYSPLRHARNAFLEKHYAQYGNGRRGSLPLCRRSSDTRGRRTSLAVCS